MSKYLLELGCEELPYKFINSARNQLKTAFSDLFNNNAIKYNSIEVLATPRRLAVIVDGLPEKQENETKILRGPVRRVAYNEDGTLSKAGEGFFKEKRSRFQQCIYSR